MVILTRGSPVGWMRFNCPRKTPSRTRFAYPSDHRPRCTRPNPMRSLN